MKNYESDDEIREVLVIFEKPFFIFSVESYNSVATLFYMNKNGSYR